MYSYNFAHVMIYRGGSEIDIKSYKPTMTIYHECTACNELYACMYVLIYVVFNY